MWNVSPSGMSDVRCPAIGCHGHLIVRIIDDPIKRYHIHPSKQRMSIIIGRNLGWKRNKMEGKNSRRKAIEYEAASRAFSGNGATRNLPPLPNVETEDAGGLDTLFHHPYGVLPYGNIYMSDTGDSVRHSGLGPLLKRLHDEQLIHILGFLDAPALARLSFCSRFLYVAAHYDDLWRDLTLRHFQKGFNFIKGGTWKDTFISNSIPLPEPVPIIHKPFKVHGIFSDTFFRPWLCKSFTIQPSWLSIENIPTEHVSTLSLDRFITQYEQLNRPVLIKDATRTWPAIQHWSDPNYLLQHSQHTSFRATSGAAPLAAKFTMQSYMNYCHPSSRSMEEAPLYLFDRTFDTTCPQLKVDYEQALRESCPYFDPHATHGHDLFGLLGKDKRPDYRWIIAGPKRSGSSFHIDPNATHAWNAPITGRKRWIFYPPAYPPPGVFPSESGDEVIMPISLGEWFLTYYDQHVTRRQDKDPKKRPFECTVAPGDILFVPHGWWHCVLNLDEGMNIALTQNYVSCTNLPDVLRFLEFKPQQISGCRDRPEAIKPDRFFSEFVLALREHRPLLLADATEIAKKGWTCEAWKDDEQQGTTDTNEGHDCYIDSFRKRKRGRSVIEQAKLVQRTVTNEDISPDKCFTFSFI